MFKNLLIFCKKEIRAGFAFTGATFAEEIVTMNDVGISKRQKDLYWANLVTQEPPISTGDHTVSCTQSLLVVARPIPTSTLVTVDQVIYSCSVFTLAFKWMANILCTWTVLMPKVAVLMVESVMLVKSSRKNRQLQLPRHSEHQMIAPTSGAEPPNPSSRSTQERDAANGTETMEFYSCGQIKSSDESNQILHSLNIIFSKKHNK